MSHDFIKDKINEIKYPRFDQHNVSCLNKGGIMDYAKELENDKTRWSTCSIEGFTALMNSNKTCLKVIDPKHPPPNPNPPILTQNECDISKAYPGLNGVHVLWLNGRF